MAAEREARAQELARLDLDVPQVEVEGARDDRVWRCATTSTSTAGPVRVERSLYRSPRGGRAVCPLELRAGIIEGSWTSLAAKQATWGRGAFDADRQRRAVCPAREHAAVDKHAGSVAQSLACPLGGKAWRV